MPKWNKPDHWHSRGVQEDHTIRHTIYLFIYLFYLYIPYLN